MNVPEDLRYATSHEWLRADGTVGITDHAQHELTDVVFVDLPQVGKEVKAGEVVCVIESVKAASDIYAPVTGKITAINLDLSGDPANPDKPANPALVNTDPYNGGWLFKIEAADPGERDTLHDAAAYKSLIG